MFNAKVALNQLTASNNGVGTLKMMIGAKNLCQDEKQGAVMFRFTAKAKNKSNYCKLTLDGRTDTYTMEFLSVRGMSVKEKGVFKGLYNQQLMRTFENETGLYLKL